ncbi:MAG: T9SS type A sorting domain-containing protein, partial [Flavobacteriales bacterium]
TVVVVSPVHYLEKSDKSVEQSSLLEGLNFSPNPNNGQFQVNFELKQKGKTKIEIRNIQGQLVYEEDLGKIKGKYSNFIDISNEGAGTYILSVLQGKQRIAERIIVQ